MGRLFHGPPRQGAALVLMAAFALGVSMVAAGAGAIEQYRLDGAVFSSAGGLSGNSAHSLAGSLGQGSPTGESSLGGLTLRSGFWGMIRVLAGTTDVPSQRIRTTLRPNYPNPFNPSTTIEFVVAETAPVTVEIFDVKGRRVATLIREEFQPGAHQVTWEGTDESGRGLASGIYFCRMQAGDYSRTIKMLLVK